MYHRQTDTKLRIIIFLRFCEASAPHLGNGTQHIASSPETVISLVFIFGPFLMSLWADGTKCIARALRQVFIPIIFSFIYFTLLPTQIPPSVTHSNRGGHHLHKHTISPSNRVSFPNGHFVSTFSRLELQCHNISPTTTTPS